MLSQCSWRLHPTPSECQLHMNANSTSMPWQLLQHQGRHANQRAKSYAAWHTQAADELPGPPVLELSQSRIAPISAHQPPAADSAALALSPRRRTRQMYSSRGHQIVTWEASVRICCPCSIQMQNGHMLAGIGHIMVTTGLKAGTVNSALLLHKWVLLD